MNVNVAQIAKLANLPLDKKDYKKFEKQLSDTLTYIETLNEINTEDVEPTSQVTGLMNVMRDDIVTASLTQDEALANAKNTYKGFFKVKAILNTE